MPVNAINVTRDPRIVDADVQMGWVFVEVFPMVESTAGEFVLAHRDQTAETWSVVLRSEDAEVNVEWDDLTEAESDALTSRLEEIYPSLAVNWQDAGPAPEPTDPDECPDHLEYTAREEA